MKIAIFGSRKIDTEKAYKFLYDNMISEHEYITSGKIKGVAEIARQIAAEKGLKIQLYNYKSDNGLYTALQDIAVKNKRMVEACEAAIVIWNGTSKGTEREIQMLKKNNKHIILNKIN